MAPLDGQGRVTAQNILRAATSRKYKKVFFLGPFARRVSFASQQNRALNLVWALHALDIVSAAEEIAVVGAGLAGLTATAALLERGHRVSLYETKDDVMSRHISASHRFIHPTINRWPERHVVETTAVPYFDWLSDDCSQLAKTLRMEWAKLKDRYDTLSFKKRITVGGFGETRRGVGISTNLSAGDGKRTFYKAAIVTSGFADEDYGDKSAFPGYWDADDLDKLVESGEIEEFLVSGCGDGGLIDALRIAHRDFRNGLLIVDVAKALQDHQPKWPHLELIKKAEAALVEDGKRLEEAVETGSEALKLVYEAAAADLPEPVARMLGMTIRDDRKVEFVTLMSRQRNPYSPMSAPIHKLLISHAIEQQVVAHAQCNVESWVKNQITTAPVGAKPGDAAPRTVWEGHVILRHGARPKFGVFFKSDEAGVVKELIDQQKLTADELDEPLWAAGGRRLIEWPPSVRAAEALLQREPQAARLIGRIVGQAKGMLRPQETRGFVFKYEESDLSADDIAKLPSAIFGFPLTAEQRGFEPVNFTDACGSLFPRDELEAGDAVRPGMKINAGVNARLGPILINDLGEFFAITASHAVPSPRAPLAVLNGQSRIIGHITACPEDEFCRSFGATLIRLVPGFALEPEYCGFAALGAAVDDRHVFAKPAIIGSLDGGTIAGYVSGTGVTIRFKDPGGSELTTIEDVIQVRSRDPSSSFADRGDSGAPVVNETGQLVGILLARDDMHSYVAPVAAILRKLGVRPIEEPVREADGGDASAPVGQIYGVARELYARANRRDQDLGWIDLGGAVPTEEERIEAEQELAELQSEEAE